MCGILGTLPKSDSTQFRKALHRLSHRGPDSSGVWEAAEISLGHRRLAILDLSPAGHQPMGYADDRYQITFNGEIYNFKELRSMLINKGHSFQSESDTEVVLAAYVEWKEECVHKFNGMWALAIWDRKTKRLFLSRDRFGKKPLFYSLGNDRFVFASEMKAIFPFLNQVSPSKHFSWAVENIFSYENTDVCLVDGIQRFPAGHHGYYKNGKLSVKRYWNTLDHLVTVPSDYKKQTQEFHDLFMDACKIRMLSDVPIGTALSGGLDSSAITASIAQLNKSNSPKNNWQKSVVAGFPGSFLDETKFAKKVVEHLKIQADYINIEPLKNWNKLEEYFYLFEDIYITPPLPMIMTYESIKKSGITVSIDGHGADELFSGYGHLIHALWDSKFNFPGSIEILNTIKSSQKNFKGSIRIDSMVKRYVNFMGKELLKRMLHRDNKNSQDSSHSNFSQMDNLTQELYIIFHETILPTLLRNYDRYSMINGVEIRMPFMDHRLVSYSFSLPFTSKVGNGYSKRILRDAVAPYLPPEIAYRKSKIGFNSPIIEWMQGPLSPYFKDITSSSDFLNCSLIDNPHKLRADIFSIIAKRKSYLSDGEKIWSEFSKYLWEKSVIKNNRGTA